jgi:hypothetical protein
MNFHETLDHLGRTVGRGPIHRRATTLGEFLRGHRSALYQFRAKPGRWFVVLDTVYNPCPDCDVNAGSQFVQFLALEDGVSVLGECGSHASVDDDMEFTRAEEGRLSSLGWSPPNARTPNWSFEASSDEDLATLHDLAGRTFREVFALEDESIVELALHEVIVEDVYVCHFRISEIPDEAS